jgi:hypothetical protein
MKRTLLTTGAALVTIAVAGLLATERKLEDLDVSGIQAMLATTEGAEQLAKMAHDQLAVNPKHAFAKFMQGVVLFKRSGDAGQKGDMGAAAKMYQDSMTDMNEAVAWEPDSLEVRIPRGAMFITASRDMPEQMSKPLLETGVSDFEHVLQLQEADGEYGKLSNHQRGELLTGLGDGYARLGDTGKARAFFDRIEKELPGTVYEARAEAWMEGKPESKSSNFFACVGCHAKK